MPDVKIETEVEVKKRFLAERVSYRFGSVSFRTDRVFVSKDQAQESMDNLSRLKAQTARKLKEAS